MNTLEAIDHPSSDHFEDVASAANWLDTAYPGWASKVPDTFNMTESWNCIGFYIGADWWSDLTLGWWRHSGSDYDGIFASHTNVWRLEIQNRQKASQDFRITVQKFLGEV